MSLHADLLSQAEHLIQLDARRPRQASLRRAVSTAYYALFHLLTFHSARQIVSGANQQALRQTVHRAFKHGDMKTVAKQFASGRADGRWGAALAQTQIDDDVRLAADAFVTLQEARHAADYDVSRSFTRGETVEFVESARAAFGAFERARSTPACRVFLVALLVQKSVTA